MGAECCDSVGLGCGAPETRRCCCCCLSVTVPSAGEIWPAYDERDEGRCGGCCGCCHWCCGVEPGAPGGGGCCCIATRLCCDCDGDMLLPAGGGAAKSMPVGAVPAVGAGLASCDVPPTCDESCDESTGPLGVSSRASGASAGGAVGPGGRLKCSRRARLSLMSSSVNALSEATYSLAAGGGKRSQYAVREGERGARERKDETHPCSGSPTCSP